MSNVGNDFKSRIITKFERRYSFVLHLLALFLMLSFTAIFWHGDGDFITRWAYLLLESVRIGDVRHYATFVASQMQATNYNVLTNCFDALLLAPLYLVDQLLGDGLPVAIYQCWMRIILVAACFATGRILKRVAVFLGCNSNRAEWLSIFYLLSTPVLFGNLSMGQIDCVAALFWLLAFYYFLTERFYRMAFWFSAACCYKIFVPIFIFAPFICFLFYRLPWKKLLKGLGIFLVLPVVSFLLSHVFFIDYAKIKSQEELYWNHLHWFFDYNWSGASVFLIIVAVVCVMCLVRSKSGTVTKRDYIFAPLVVAAAFNFASIENPMWLVCVPIFFLLVAVYDNLFAEVMILYVIWNGALYLRTFVINTGLVDLTMFNLGVIPRFFSGTPVSTAMTYLASRFPLFASYLGQIARTVLVACDFAVIILLWNAEKFERDYSNGEIVECKTSVAIEGNSGVVQGTIEKKDFVVGIIGTVALFTLHIALIIWVLCLYFG